MVTEQQIKERIDQLEYEKAELREQYLNAQSPNIMEELLDKHMTKCLLVHTLNWVLNG